LALLKEFVDEHRENNTFQEKTALGATPVRAEFCITSYCSIKLLQTV